MIIRLVRAKKEHGLHAPGNITSVDDSCILTWRAFPLLISQSLSLSLCPFLVISPFKQCH